ncbi:glycosyltransferase family 4 protein [Methylomonas sp. LL1]|uniref:glycosyltransferase family 4 protein n=1 Tax=Methylomonas sp. LL1 TaxID=2785785 RepID=UPI0018C3D2A3|nr:glycosyltransferase family 1 protein [Methylomonas sp. LL1]QPK63422.1 glycosyltransferase family 4 protein [Methylomonas sp. LL1]
MNRIGIFLGFPPEGGGVFQYSQSVVEALASLPQTEFTIVVAHTQPAWREKLREYDNRFELVPIQDSKIDAMIGLALRVGLPIRPWRLVAKYIHPFTRLLLKQTCDLWIFPAQDVWTYAIPTPAIGVIHDLMHRYESRFPEVSRFGLFYRRERHYQRLCRYSEGVLVDSGVGKRQVKDSYAVAEECIHVLPFVAPNYILNAQVPEDFDRHYCLPEKFIFYPAQFWEHKNHINLLRALYLIRQAVPNLHLVLSGSKKNAYAKVMLEIENLQLSDRVHVFGYVPDADIGIMYRRARALVMPTFFGPTNIPPLEAMAAGCPVAVSRIYGMPEQVADAALLFDPESVNEIAQVIHRLATDDELCQRLTIAGKLRAAQWGQQQFNERFRFILKSVMRT